MMRSMSRLPRRIAALLALSVAVTLALPADALAAVSVQRATLTSGSLRVEGQGARANANVTVTSPESTASRTADSKGEYKVTASGFRSSTCKATVSDGSTSVVATLSGCTSAPPPPPPAPAPAVAAVTLSHTSLDTVDSLAVGSVELAAQATTAVDVALSSSHPAIAPVDRATVQVAAGARSASFLVRYATAVTQPTVATISASSGGVTKTVTLTLNPPRAFGLTPASGELGPGFVGSDFTTFATLPTTLTLGPGAVGPARFAIIAGQLPAGLMLKDLNTSQTPAKHINISVAGIPTTVGTSTFTVEGVDANGQTATGTYTIRVNAAQTLVINLQEPWSPQVGVFSNLWIDGSGGVRPYTWTRIAGQLPPGMSLVQDNRSGPLVRITGTPTTAGTFTFTLQLRDAQGVTASRAISITVAPP